MTNFSARASTYLTRKGLPVGALSQIVASLGGGATADDGEAVRALMVLRPRLARAVLRCPRATP